MEMLSAMLLALALAAGTLLLLRSALRGRAGRLPPGPRGLPVLGSLLALDAAAPHESLAALARRYDPRGAGAFSLRLGAVRCVVLTDAALVRRALELDACAGRAPLFLTHGIMEGRGIICAEGELWREQRRLVAAWLRALGMVRVGARRHRLERRVAAGAAALVSRLRSAASDAAGQPEAVDPAPLLLHFVGNVVSGVVFGVEWAEDDPTWRWLLHLQEEGTKHIGVAGAINFLPFLRFLPHYRRVIAFIKDGQAETHAVYARMASAIEEALDAEEAKARENVEKEPKGDAGDEHGEVEEGAGEAEGHILGAFVAEQRRRRARALNGEGVAAALRHFSDKQRHCVVADMFGAGLDTTMMSLRWFLLLMATHPEEQELVWEELQGALGERPPALEDAAALPRLQAALAEAQRMRPVVPVGIPHGVTQEVRLGEWTLPVGTMVLPLLWAVHHDKRHFPEPHLYRPQRFLAEDGRFTRPAEFMPFQAGKRMCVGETMANMMLLLFGGALLHAFRVIPAPNEPPPDLEGECGITLAPRPHRLVFQPRR